MKVPAGWQDMTDEELLEELKKHYDDSAAQYVLDTLRGNLDEGNGKPIYE